MANREFHNARSQADAAADEMEFIYVQSISLETELAKVVVGNEVKGENLQLSSVRDFLYRMHNDRAWLRPGRSFSLIAMVDGECAANKDGFRLMVELERCFEAKVPSHLALLVVGILPLMVSPFATFQHINVGDAPNSGEPIWQSPLKLETVVLDVGSTIMDIITRRNASSGRFRILSLWPVARTRRLVGMLNLNLSHHPPFQHVVLTGMPEATRRELDSFSRIFAQTSRARVIVSISDEQLPVCLPMEDIDVIVASCNTETGQTRLDLDSETGVLRERPRNIAIEHSLAWNYFTKSMGADFVCAVGEEAEGATDRPHIPILNKDIHWAAYFLSVSRLMGGEEQSRSWRHRPFPVQQALNRACHLGVTMEAILPAPSFGITFVSDEGLWNLENALLNTNIDPGYPMEAARLWAWAGGPHNIATKRLIIRVGAIIAAGIPRGKTTLHNLNRQTLARLPSLFRGLPRKLGNAGYLWIMLGLWEHYRDSRNGSFDDDLKETIEGKDFVLDKAWAQAVQSFVVVIERHLGLSALPPRSHWLQFDLSQAERDDIDRMLALAFAHSCLFMRVTGDEATGSMMFEEPVVNAALPLFFAPAPSFDMTPFSTDGVRYAGVATSLFYAGEPEHVVAEGITLLQVRVVAKAFRNRR
ncbi:hypothetical protein MAPG_04866 [Magnaporthiopsis poae ATCC 64411]|uniref:Uncharacterized protein n=1 Tax=Magnaporthiopsis poae (strain ATCC 64411 / 73-15) TaxID=644358 RepID=A0A0C4DXV9_MAGP6|nr:hypothetical protein MAPG_04866 [Magnaporthiopsis poae ATCC 64411]